MGVSKSSCFSLCSANGECHPPALKMTETSTLELPSAWDSLSQDTLGQGVWSDSTPATRLTFVEEHKPF